MTEVDPLLEFGRIMREVNRKLNKGVAGDQVLDFLFDSLHPVLIFDRMSIALLEDGGRRVRTRWVKTTGSLTHLSDHYEAPLAGSSLEEVLRTGLPRVIDDLEVYCREHPESVSTRLALAEGIRSNLACPLVENSRRIGFIFFSSGKPHTFSSLNPDLFMDIAEELSLIVERGHLREFFDENVSRVRTLRTVLHDLRGPLSVIHGLIEISRQEPWFNDLDAEAKEIFSSLGRNADFMISLLEDLDRWGSCPDSEFQDEMESVDLRRACGEWSAYGQVLASRKGIDFESRLSPDLPQTALLNPKRLRQVMENLFANAVKFSFPKSRIFFEVEPCDGSLVFRVTDQGLGIPQEEIPLLFRDFSKTSARPTAGETSTGLGLAIVRKIVELHQGTVGVKSEVGRGSTFWFSIPLRARLKSA